MANLSSLRRFMDNFMQNLLQMGMSIEQARAQAKIWLDNQMKEYAQYQANQKEMAEIYRKNQLAGYEAYGNIQETAAQKAFGRSALLNLINPDYFKELPLPPYQVAKTIGGYFPPEAKAAIGVNIPAGEEQKYADTIAAIQEAAKTRQSLGIVPEQTAAVVAQNIGYKPLMDLIQQIQAQKQADLERAVREKGLVSEADKTKLGYAQIGVREKELAAEVSPAKYYEKFVKPKTNEILKYLAGIKMLPESEFRNLNLPAGFNYSTLGKLMSRVSALDSIGYERKWTPSETAEVDSAWNLVEASKTLGEPGILDKIRSIIGEVGTAIKNIPAPALPSQPAPAAPPSIQPAPAKQLDKYGYFLGQEWPIPSGPLAGTWVYVGNNQWSRKQ